GAVFYNYICNYKNSKIFQTSQLTITLSRKINPRDFTSFVVRQVKKFFELRDSPPGERGQPSVSQPLTPHS
ncbi:MAG: hypothetical protein IJP91_05185, partial [Synergistaceae bacterium]|nr:hypothetical protein [Synergistaceae bacterium]